MSRGFTSSWRLGLLSLGVLVSFGGIGYRLVHLHVIEREQLLQYVEQVRKDMFVYRARRGNVLDAKGNILATSRMLYEVGVDPEMLKPEDAPKWPELARLIGLAQPELAARMKPASLAHGSEETEVRMVRWRKLHEQLDEETYERIKALGIKGVYGTPVYRRAYPGGSLASHVLGFVNREDTAVTGVERYMDFFLSGQDGWRESERDGRRRELAQFRSREVPPSDGYQVVLSLDMMVQHIIEEELALIAKTYSPKSATVIVSEVESGFILGLANYPNYDLNAFNRADVAHQRNLAVTDMFEPGSTFKIVAAAAALEEGLVTPDTRFDCGIDFIEYRGRRISLPRDSHDNGILSVTQIVGKSSNIGAAHLGVNLGADRLYEYSRRFGFGRQAGFPIGGEIAGVLHPVSNWDGLTITRLPMGHAVAATPLQIHYAMSAIANGGVLMKPQIIRQILDQDGLMVHKFDRVGRDRVVSPRTAQTVARMLQQVVSDEGTAPRAAIPGYEVAGKTGTSRKIIDGKYSSRHHVGSFVGFFPASRPRIVISVFVDDGRVPSGGTAYGSVVAAPSFKRVGEQLIQYLGVEPPAGSTNYLAMERTRL